MIPYASFRPYYEEYADLIDATTEGKYLIVTAFEDESIDMLRMRFKRVARTMNIEVVRHRSAINVLALSFIRPQVIDVAAELERADREKAAKAAQPKKQRTSAQAEFKTALKRKARGKSA